MVAGQGGLLDHRKYPEGEPIRLRSGHANTFTKKHALIVLAGKEYGSGSSRDWAAKGSNLLGVRAVIAESYERIHRNNLVGMGVLPLEFMPGDNARSLGLTGTERFDVGV
jgi:aconitate hydratase